MLGIGLIGRTYHILTRSQAHMAKILSDREIRKLLGTVIVNGDVNCIRPNAYVLRLGAKGEFLNTGMKDSEWEDGRVKGGPQDILDDLINSGYPWRGLGLRLKEIDQQFHSVT